jgi:hypothetical protein
VESPTERLLEHAASDAVVLEAELLTTGVTTQSEHERGRA